MPYFSVIPFSASSASDPRGCAPLITTTAGFWAILESDRRGDRLQIPRGRAARDQDQVCGGRGIEGVVRGMGAVSMMQSCAPPSAAALQGFPELLGVDRDYDGRFLVGALVMPFLRAGLLVEVDDDDGKPLRDRGACEVHGERGLPRPALLGNYGYRFHGAPWFRG